MQDIRTIPVHRDESPSLRYRKGQDFVIGMPPETDFEGMNRLESRCSEELGESGRQSLVDEAARHQGTARTCSCSTASRA